MVTLAPMLTNRIPRTGIPMQRLHHAAAAPLPMEKVEQIEAFTIQSPALQKCRALLLQAATVT